MLSASNASILWCDLHIARRRAQKETFAIYIEIPLSGGGVVVWLVVREAVDEWEEED